MVLGLMLLIGLPHGATDHGLYSTLVPSHSIIGKANFYLLYALVIGAYGLLWYFLSLVAFALFILLSVYHFGQSNWADVDYKNEGLARLHYLFWGCGILLTPILLHGQEATFIVAEMTDTLLVLPEKSYLLLFIGLSAIANLLIMLYCYSSKLISGSRLGKELLGYGLLLLMFFTNSLLLGFTVYFVFWHSLASAKDQLKFFQPRLSPDVRRQLIIGVVATLGGALTFCLIVWFGPGPEAALRPGVIGGVFIFISLVTLPHMLLVEQLYNQWSPAEKQKKTVVKPERVDAKEAYHNLQLRS